MKYVNERIRSAKPDCESAGLLTPVNVVNREHEQFFP